MSHPARPPSAAAATADDRRQQSRRLTAVIALTASVLVVEVIGGVLSGSLALLSDAGHMLTDLLALVLSLMAVRFASLPATQTKTYGYHRLEILTALLNGSLLLLISAGIVYHAVLRFLEPRPIASGTMTVVALIGLAANVVSISALSRGRQCLNLRGARMHVVGDALSSCGVLIAALGIRLTGWQRLDAIVAALIAVVIITGAVHLVREAVDVLLEATPTGIDLARVSAAISGVPGVVEVHDLHVWSITTGLAALSGHVRIGRQRGAFGDDDLLNRIKQVVGERFGIVHTTIQIESETYEEVGDVH